MITIDYFSDLLCVWAYGGQVRLDALQRDFAGRVRVRHRYLSLFADTATRIGEGWREQGGFDGFARHMHEVCAQWEHARPAEGAWSRCRPASCVTGHVFLRAVALCLGLDDGPGNGPADRAYDGLVARLRAAFFEQARDIGELAVLRQVLAESDVDLDFAAVAARIDNGEAYAALHRDQELARSLGVLGSPTYVFNEGRQLLYGNVGYRIIEANVQELLHGRGVDGEPSWC